MKVVIEVEGGMVARVISDYSNLQYIVVDKDSIKCGDDPPNNDDWVLTEFTLDPLGVSLDNRDTIEKGE
jgi:hypothetical protein